MSEKKQILGLSNLHSTKKADAKGKPAEKKEVKDAFAIVPVPGSRKRRKRIGRGRATGVGKTSGRGQKGQKARAGFKNKLGFEGGQNPLRLRLPKRGFTNIFATKYQVVNLKDLKEAGLTGEVTPATLRGKGLISKPAMPVKILGVGECGKVQVTADAFSASAKAAIEKAGGSVKIRPDYIPRVDRKFEKKAERKARKKG